MFAASAHARGLRTDILVGVQVFSLKVRCSQARGLADLEHAVCHGLSVKRRLSDSCNIWKLAEVWPAFRWTFSREKSLILTFQVFKSELCRFYLLLEVNIFFHVSSVDRHIPQRMFF